MSSIPTTQEIVSLYLYGQKTPPGPSELKDNRWIRNADQPTVLNSDGVVSLPFERFGALITIDANEYMTTGAGRFATAEKFDFIKNFLNNKGDFAVGVYRPVPGSTTGRLEDALGTKNATVSQYVMGMYDADYTDRAYVSGSTAFTISSGEFIVNPDGTREIRNLKILPLNDNFDYQSDNPIATVTNVLTKNQIDPSGIGRRVDFEFSNKDNVPLITSLTLAGLNLLEASKSNENALNNLFKGRSQPDYAVVLASALINVGPRQGGFLAGYLTTKFALTYQQLRNSGAIDFRDESNRFVYFDAQTIDHDIVISAEVALQKILTTFLPTAGFIPKPYQGVALIGGGGADSLIGGEQSDALYGGTGNDDLSGKGGNDYLEGGVGADTLIGGDGNDQLLGGAGNDTYQFTSAWGKDTILDADGQGSIQLGDKTLGTFQGVGSQGAYAFELGAGTGIYAGLAINKDSASSTGYRATIVKGTDKSHTITIQNFDLDKAQGTEGYLGIKLGGQRIALVQGTGQAVGASTANVYADTSFNTSTLDGKTSTLGEGNGKSFHIYLSNAAQTGDTLTLNISGALSDKLQIRYNGQRIDANGAVITLTEGDTLASIALVSDEEIDEDQLGSISATFNGSGQGSQNAASNSWELTLKDAGESTKTILGDQHGPVAVNVDTGKEYYDWAATEGYDAEGQLIGGQAEADFEDVLNGTEGKDNIKGLGGNDYLSGGGGNDTLEGGDGNDVITGGEGSDTILGGAGDDIISSAGGQSLQARHIGPDDANFALSNVQWSYISTSTQDGDVVDAGAGDDLVIASWGDDRVEGGAGKDKIYGLAGNDLLEGNEGDDEIWGDGVKQTDTIVTTVAAAHGNDFIDGGEGKDIIVGQGGADQLFGGSGDDRLFGDDTESRLSAEFHGDDYIDGEDGDDEIVGQGGADILYGGAGNDLLLGDDTESLLNGSAHGNDYLDGEEGDDELAGLGGDDTLFGGAGNDKLIGDANVSPETGFIRLAGQFHGNDYLDGEDGDDQIFGDGGNDILFGGRGNDELFGDSQDPNLNPSFHGEDTLDGEEGDDYLEGGAKADILFGGEGNDILIGDSDVALLAGAEHGNDYLDGGDGNDKLFGYGGNDILIGGKGNDVLSGDAIESELAIEFHGADQLSGGEGDDILYGNAGDDVLDGGAGNDQLFGGVGNDVLDGGDGDDTLFGGGGIDVLRGGAGNDRLIAAAGSTLDGGEGLDTYVLTLGATTPTTLNDDSVEGSVIELEGRRVDIDLMSATRVGDDLQLNGASIGVNLRIQNYYSVNPATGGIVGANWQLKGNDGVIVTAQQVVAATEVRWDTLIEDLLRQERRRIKHDAIHSNPTNGAINREYELLSNGTFGVSYIAPGTVQNTLTDTNLVSITNYSPIGGGTPYTRTTSIPWTSSSSLSSFGVYSYGLNFTSGISSYVPEANVNVFFNSNILTGSSQTASSGQAWAQVAWSGENYSSQRNYSFSYGSGLETINGTQYYVWQQNFLRDTIQTSTGSFVGLADQVPSVSQTQGLKPKFVSANNYITTTNVNLGGYRVEDGNFTVAARDGAIIFGGNGNQTYAPGSYQQWGQTANQAAFIQAGAGNSTISGAHVIVAGDGNQTLSGGEVMVLGNGQTTTIGNVGSLIYARANNGVDVIAAHEKTVWELLSGGGQNVGYAGVLSAIYTGMGYGYWYESLAHAGEYKLISHGRQVSDFLFDYLDSNPAYFASEQAIREAYNTWASGYFSEDDTSISFEAAVSSGYLSSSYVEPLPLILRTPGLGLSSSHYSNYEISSYYANNKTPIVDLNPTHPESLEPFRQYLNPESYGSQRVLIDPSIDPSSLAFSWSQIVHPENGQTRASLDISWGFEQGLRIVMPHSGTAFDSAQTEVSFANGTVLTLAQMIALAGTPPNFDVGYYKITRGMGAVDVSLDNIPGGFQLEGLTLSDLFIVRSSYYDIKIYLRDNLSDVLTINYLLEYGTPPFPFKFADGTILGVTDIVRIAHGNMHDPSIGFAINNQLVNDKDAWSWVIPAGAFVDSDAATGDKLRYSVEHIVIVPQSLDEDGEIVDAYTILKDIPSWLSFDAATNTFSVLAGTAPVGEIDIQIRATDITGLSATSVVRLNVEHANAAPTVSFDAASISEESLQIAGNVLTNDTDADAGDVLSVSNAGAFVGLYGTLQINANGSYTYTLRTSDAAVQGLRAGQVVTEVFSYTATDDDATKPLTAASTLTISITGTNDAPVLAQALAPQTAAQGVAFSYTLPTGAFTDIDAGDALTFTATQANGSPLPSWLVFDSATRSFSGTARNRDAGTLQVIVTATDNAGVSATGNFELIATETAGLILNGTSAANTLMGGGGDDVIDGKTGADTMIGGDGDDLYYVNTATDAVLEQADNGIDTVYSTTTYVLPEHVEVLRLTGTANNRATGNAQANTLIGNSGNNRLDGGAGIDVMAGAAGNDTYVVDNSLDIVVELDAAGLDTVETSVDYSLTAHVENLTAKGTTAVTAHGNETDNILTANAAGNTLYGWEGNDTLKGGLGDDVLIGGQGNDTLAGSSGRDILDGGDGDDSLSGGAGEDELYGGAGNDTLVAGGDGDLLAAGSGDDTLQGDSGADVLVAGQGADTVLGGGGNDFMLGGAGNDSLDGGSANDWLAAGSGNDLITLGAGKDVMAFNRGDGQDTLNTEDNQSDILSLGGGIRYADIKLKKLGNDLVIDLGQGEGITCKDWYTSAARRSIRQLQVVTTASSDFEATSTDRLRNRSVVVLDFWKLTAAFDLARASNVGLNAGTASWSALPSLNASYQSGSNTQAIGGDLSWRYGTQGHLGALSWQDVRAQAANTAVMSNWTQDAAPPLINPWTAMEAGISLIAQQSISAQPVIDTRAIATQDELITAALNTQGQLAGVAQPRWL
jgi:VCBS repeat-containing protein